MPSQRLLERFRAEARAAEVAHAFPSTNDTASKTPGPHFQISLGLEYKFFLNSYQVALAVANHTVGANLHDSKSRGLSELWAGGKPLPNIADFAETGIFGCRPFANESAPTWEEAADRMIYVAHNMRRLDFGSVPMFGDAVAIFSNAYIRDMVLIAPLDTGLWEMACNLTLPWPPPPVDCRAWKSLQVATFDHFDHIILANLGAWDKDSETEGIYDAARELFERSPFAGNYSRLPNISFFGMMKYWETNIVGNPRFPDAVRFLIGSFNGVFGTQMGKSLQAFADAFGWPLLWASPTFFSARRGPPRFDDNTSFVMHDRVLDPTVRAARRLNSTMGPDASVDFWAIWEAVGRGRAGASEQDWARWWRALAGGLGSVAPVTAASCRDVDGCVGTDMQTGACICKQSAASAPWHEEETLVI